jgi:hypothetical protein
MIGNHLRSNAVGYMALFVALGGTAAALPGSDTVFSDDIVDGEVRAPDISNENGVRTFDVRNDTEEGGGLAAIDLAAGSVGSSEIVDDAVDFSDLAADSVRNFEIAAGEVRGSEIAENAIGSGEIAGDQVGALELKGIHEHASSEEIVIDDIGRDAIWGRARHSVSCEPNEDLLSASVDWVEREPPEPGEAVREEALAEIEIDRIGTDVATAEVISDTGGRVDDNDFARFRVVATCLAL